MSLILKYDLGNPHRLPVGYTPLAYIESSGTLFINSGVVLNSNTSIYKFYCQIETSTRDGHAHSFFGTNAYTTGFMSIYHYTNNNYYSEYIKGLNKGALGEVIAKGTKILYYLEMNLSTKTYKSKIHMHSETTGSFNEMTDTTSLITIFKSNDYSGGYWKCYYFRMFKDNKIIRDFIPAKNSSGVIGLFDCVSQTFFTNQGTGVFIAGPEVTILPYEYLQVEYLLSSGVEHINTNFTPNQNSRVEFLGCITLDKASGSPEKWHACYSEDNSWNNSSFGAWFNDTVYSYYGVEQYGSGSTYGTSVGLKATLNKRFYVDLNKNVLYWKYVGDSSNQYSKTFDSSITFTGACPLVLLATNRNGSVLAQSHFIGRIEYSKIYDNGTLVRNMIPCYRRSDLKPGMYDTVNNVFYTNSGSGEFILGPVVEESSRQLEYNNAEQPNYTPNWNVVSNWTGDGATVTQGNDYIQIAFSGNGNNRGYYLTSNLWTTTGAKYLVSGWIRTTSGTSTVLFSRSLIDYGSAVTANTTWTNFSTIITTTGTSDRGTVSIQGTSGTTILIANLRTSPVTNSYVAQKGMPYNIHYSTSNPSSTLINLGSGDFNGSSSYINCGTFLNGTSVKNTTCCMWLNPNTQSGSNLICGSQHGSNQRYYIGRLSAGYYGYGTAGSGWANITDAPVVVGTWQHIALTIDSSGVPKFYYNGVLVNTRAAQNYNFYGNFQIGCANNNESYFNGKICDFRIYDEALTADEVLKIYKGGV